MDNTASVTALTVRDNFLYVNLTLFVIYALAVFALYLVSRHQGRRIETDLEAVLRLTSTHQSQAAHWSFEEFRIIHDEVQRALETIDLLHEQKERHRMSLAHDIKTPLTVLYSHLTEEDPSPEDKAAALAAARSINELVEDLLKQTSETALHPIDLHEVIARTVQRYERVFATKGMRITTDLDEVRQNWNATDASRVLENLLGNAYEYSKQGSEVHITLRTGDTIRWTVCSSPEKPEALHLDRLFDKGYSTSSKPGKGLGLYITRLLIQPLGGTITATLDKDALRFTIALPS
jgi:signal transduction histidine kinase